MKQYKKLTMVLVIFLAVFCVVGVAGTYALDSHSIQVVASAGKQDACNGLSQVGGSCGGGEASLSKVLKGVVSIISYIAGIIAVIMVIISGIRFVTSGGDSNAVSSAKTALVYALIGIAVAILAQVLVHFVIGAAVST